jgi:hypothetical protein
MKSIKLLYNEGVYISYINVNLNLFYIQSNYKLKDFIISYQNDHRRIILNDFIINLDYELSDENKYIYKVKLNNYYFINKIYITDFRSMLNIDIEYDDEEINYDETIIEYNCITVLLEKEKFTNIKYIQFGDEKIYDDKYKIIRNKELNLFQILFEKNILNKMQNKFKIIFDTEVQYKFTLSHIPIEYIKVL